MSKVYNFSAGPAVLPAPALAASADAVREYGGTGLSILEMSHRSEAVTEVMDSAVSLVRDILGLPGGYKVIFLQGGASMQFCMVPYNLLGKSNTAAYIESGLWAKKAIKEAKILGNVKVLASSAEQNFTCIPRVEDIPEDAPYLHITSNNTIYGTQYNSFPEASVPLVADMSSDIFSRPLDVSKFGLIYAGAQKNLGPAGITLVVVREDILGKADRAIPTMLDYRTHIEKGSMFNTPPVFPLFVARETLQWLKDLGGLEAIEKTNRSKAAKLYAEIDNNPLFRGTAVKEDRSMMNIPFVVENKNHESEFLSLTIERGLSGLKGHRSVGGFRASVYNAMPEEGIDALVACMREFAEIKC